MLDIAVMCGLIRRRHQHLHISARHLANLQRARAQLGEGQAVSAYRRRANELDLQWEARQPQRTLRELLRPWEA